MGGAATPALDMARSSRMGPRDKPEDDGGVWGSAQNKSRPEAALIVVAVEGTLPRRRLLRRGDQALALGALAGQLAGPAHGFRLLAGALLGGLFVMHVPLHFAERAFALHLLLQRLKGLVDVVVADENLNQRNLSCLR